MFLAAEGTPAEPVRSDPELEVQWVTVQDGTRMSGVMEDRAARFMPEQNLLHINGDFQVFGDMVDRWASRYAHVPGARETVADIVREWFEQTLIATVMGVQALHDSRKWILDELSKALSEEAANIR